MKSVVTCILILMISILSANYVENQAFNYLQPDGKQLELMVTGDEYYRRMHDKAGYTVLRHPDTGYAVYAIQRNGEIVASDYKVGQIDPVSLNIPPSLKHNKQQIEAVTNELRPEQGTNNVRISTIGTVNNIFIFVRFLDQTEYTTPIAEYESLCNSMVNPSMRGYFLEDSSGQLTVNTSFFPNPEDGIVRSFQDGHNRGYFSPYDATTNPIGYSSGTNGRSRMHALMRTAVNIISPSVPSNLNVDGDGDAFVDNVTFVFKGEADPIWLSQLWPQQSFLDYNPLIYETVTINNKIVSCYNIQLSDQLIEPVNNTVNRIGVVCHEMSHSFGFPDLYHTTDDNLNPVGPWELMGADGYVPQPHFAYQKMKYGNWVGSIPTLTPTSTPTTYTLTSINESPFACYKIPSSSPNQFYVVEYRRRNASYGNSLPGSGLIVYRVTTSYQVGTITIPLEGNSDGPPDEIYVYRPNGRPDFDGTVNSANLSRSVGRPSIYGSSDPDPWLYNATATWRIDGNLMITDITENTGSTISFTLHGANLNVWKGDTDEYWNVASNWSLGIVPN
ncbi:MAG: M6 family metalloprotease domain-containing protein, partial [Candidatus Cloacimonetes bacterium]|nr:M6 family metalloprotease domain-containing protein [Candidatus Cloacimonadota bacterium]